jgi:hypothetical protein
VAPAASRYTFSVLALLLLAGCTSEAEQRAALDTWHDCIVHAVAQLDDHKSDPLTIAYGASPQCAGLYQRFTDAVAGSVITENAQNYMRDRARSEELRLITGEVLRQRAAGRPPPGSPKAP